MIRSDEAVRARDGVAAAAVRARRVLETSLVWDTHTCLPLRAGDERFLPQIDRMRDASIDVVSVNVRRVAAHV